MTSKTANEARTAAAQLLLALHNTHKVLTAVDLPTVSERLADYAWAGHAYEHPQALEEALAEIACAEELCKANYLLPAGDELLSEENKIAIRQLANAALARQNLDNGDSVRVEELAALARVAEKTIRMATNAARPGSMRVRKEGHWAYIDAPEALAWLSRRNDFHPTRQRAAVAQQTVITDVASLAETCRRSREQTKVDTTGIASLLGWTSVQREAYEQIEAGDITDQMTRFPPQALLALGQHFGLPKPQDFARQAYRVLALRHADTLADRQLATEAN